MVHVLLFYSTVSPFPASFEIYSLTQSFREASRTFSIDNRMSLTYTLKILNSSSGIGSMNLKHPVGLFFHEVRSMRP